MMFPNTAMPQTATSLFSAYASFATTMMIVRSMANEIVPTPVRSYLKSVLYYLFTPLSNTLTIVVEELTGMTRNQVYDSAEIYLQTKLNPNMERLKVSKTTKQKNFNIRIDKDGVTEDKFQDIHLKWRLVCIQPQKESSREKQYFELSFHKKHKDKVMDEYLPFVLAKANELKDGDRSIKLFTRDGGSHDIEEGVGHRRSVWGSINLEHPANFDTLAMEPTMKKEIMDDLNRFLRRREFYKKVGRAWKRGYLLYGPPGTGKTSLVAAMANYLKFDIYDLDLKSLYSNSELRRILLSTTNRSILVIEDIDCNEEVHSRKLEQKEGFPRANVAQNKFTLSGLLNFIDGLWSSCGDERIIVFTTNHKDRLDPALLRPGRMDMHINMSYCTFNGFKLLSSNYLSINNHHHLYNEIEGLMENAKVTPATIAEELMKSEDADVALGRVVDLLKRKKMETSDEIKEDSSGMEVQETKRAKIGSTERTFEEPKDES